MKYRSVMFPAVILNLLLLLVFPGLCSAQTNQPDTNTPAFRIVKAVQIGNLQLVATLLSSDPGLISTKEPAMDEPLLVLAARDNQPEIAALLIKMGAPVNATNRLGSNPLHLAAFTGNYKLIEMLMVNGADWKLRNQRGKTPVLYVSYGKNPEVFRLFVEKDKNILSEKTTDGAGLLHMAAMVGDTAGFSYLLSQGLDVKAEDNNGANVVHFAMGGGDKTMLKYLQDHGLDYKLMSSQGYPPVMSAMMGKRISSIAFLLDNGVGINERFPSENFTMLQLACLTESPEIALFLLNHGADVDAQENNGFTALFWTVMSNNKELTLLLLSKGADVNHRTKEGQTPLLTAVDSDSLAMVSLLAGHGADILACDADQKTALQHATVRGDLPVVNFLIAQGVPVNARDNTGKTALHYAAVYGHSEIGKALLEKGADPAITDKMKHDAAFYSAWYGNSGMSDLLAGKGNKTHGNKQAVKTLPADIVKGNAVVHYLNHSGFAIETSKHLIIFDYVPFTPVPDMPSLLNGRIQPGELKDKKVLVFVSHEHGDHYDTAIWGWHTLDPGISYVMGFNPPGQYKYVYTEPRSEKTVEGVRIHAIKSTDSGEGFLVETDGIVIYHPGDHVNKSDGLGLDYKSEIDYLAGLKKKVDIAFFPVNGCGFPDAEAVKRGNLYAIEELKPVLCLSMHADTKECEGFAELIKQKYPGIQAGFGLFPGDRFNYPEK